MILWYSRMKVWNTKCRTMQLSLWFLSESRPALHRPPVFLSEDSNVTLSPSVLSHDERRLSTTTSDSRMSDHYWPNLHSAQALAKLASRQNQFEPSANLREINNQRSPASLNRQIPRPTGWNGIVRGDSYNHHHHLFAQNVSIHRRQYNDTVCEQDLPGSYEH